MATVREIRRRIRSVKNIGQVTRALEAVSASKARRAQLQAERSRAYSGKAWEILINLSGQPGTIEHPLMKAPDEIKKIDLVLVTSDRGLAGAFNMNIIRVAEDFVQRIGVPVRWITVGRKGRDYLVRRRRNVVAEFAGLPDRELSFNQISSIGSLLVQDFLSGDADGVFIAYTDYISVLSQRPRVANLLPLKPFEHRMVEADYYKTEPQQTVANREYIYEPSAAALLDEIVPRFTALQVYQAILESLASEHAARMVAMRNASENSDTLVEGLTLVYNKVRQQSITSEILDIVGGVEALKSAPKPKEDKGSDNAVYDSGRSLTEQVSSVLDSVIKAADEQLEKITSALRGDDEDEEDDLTLIEGIGEKVAGALKTSGIKTFKQLAEAAAAELERLVKEVHGVRMVGSAATWSKQAQYILDGDMDGLKAYQTRLVSGREK
jgi:F-type H+-transporting ATPase subunit gamma